MHRTSLDPYGSLLLSLSLSLPRYQPEGANEETRVVAALRRVVNDLDQRNQVVPYAFLTIFRDTFPQFAEQAEGGGFAQQDADECLSSLIRCLGNVSPLPQGDGAPSNIVAQLFSGTLHTRYDAGFDSVSIRFHCSVQGECERERERERGNHHCQSMMDAWRWNSID